MRERRFSRKQRHKEKLRQLIDQYIKKGEGNSSSTIYQVLDTVMYMISVNLRGGR